MQLKRGRSFEVDPEGYWTRKGVRVVQPPESRDNSGPGLLVLLLILVLIAVLVALVEEDAVAMPSGDPTVKLLVGEAEWNAGTPMASSPHSLTRLGGKVGIDLCYYNASEENPCAANPSWCPTCLDWEPGKTITLGVWCQRLDALAMPQPPLPGDKRPVCNPAWKI